MLRLGLGANAGGAGETDDSEGTTNIVSWNSNVLPETVRPERPVVAGKLRVKE